MIVKVFLRKFGDVDVTIVVDGKKVLDVYKFMNFNFDLIFMDC